MRSYKEQGQERVSRGAYIGRKRKVWLCWSRREDERKRKRRYAREAGEKPCERSRGSESNLSPSLSLLLFPFSLRCSCSVFSSSSLPHAPPLRLPSTSVRSSVCASRERAAQRRLQHLQTGHQRDRHIGTDDRQTTGSRGRERAKGERGEREQRQKSDHTHASDT